MEMPICESAMNKVAINFRDVFIRLELIHLIYVGRARSILSAFLKVAFALNEKPNIRTDSQIHVQHDSLEPEGVSASRAGHNSEILIIPIFETLTDFAAKRKVDQALAIEWDEFDFVKKALRRRNDTGRPGQGCVRLFPGQGVRDRKPRVSPKWIAIWNCLARHRFPH